MYPDPFYNTGNMYPQMNPSMWTQMPPGYPPMPYPEQSGCPGGNCGATQGSQDFGFTQEGWTFPSYGPPPPPDFSGYYPM